MKKREDTDKSFTENSLEEVHHSVDVRSNWRILKLGPIVNTTGKNSGLKINHY